MDTYIILLRGINVGGHRKIKMAGFKQLLQDHAFVNVQTYIQSGNIICQSTSQVKSAIKLQIEVIIEENYGFQVSVIVLKKEDLEHIMSSNPFVQKQIPIEKLYYTLLEEQPDLETQKKLLQFQNEDETFIFGPAVLYCCYQKGYGKAKVTNPLIEKKLSMKATTRNWKTMNKLLEMST